MQSDDMINDNVNRRGKQCYYCLPKVGKIAINDIFLLENCIFQILKHFCSNECYYMQVVDLFQEVIRHREVGNLVDLTSYKKLSLSSSTSASSARNENLGQPLNDFHGFTLDKIKLIMKYKTSYYSFYLPVAIAMICNGM